MAPIHPDSTKSYKEEIEKGNPTTYRGKILKLLRIADRPMTDREIMTTLGVTEKSNILPEITRLVAKGVIYEYDRVRCSFTGKTVRRTKLPELKKGGE